MPRHPSYVVVGRGRWAIKVLRMLGSEGRATVSLGAPRQVADESRTGYARRMADAIADTGAHIAWLCVPPGPHVPTLVQAALEAGLHVIAEKPWHYPAEVATLGSLARAGGGLVGVDFEYCLLDGVRRWAAEIGPGSGLRFSGEFVTSGEDRLGIPALDNLGSHLLAIRELAVPGAEIGEIDCGYRRPAARRIWLEGLTGRVGEIDFAQSTEPILQRFVATFEAGTEGAAFPFDLAFAQRVAEALALVQPRRPGGEARAPQR